MPLSERARQKRRLLRQFGVVERRMPVLRRPLRMLLSDGGRIARMGAAVLFILGGVFAILPFLGLWMIPLGVLLLAVDVPRLRAPASAMTIRGRRWTSERMRRLRARGVGGAG